MRFLLLKSMGIHKQYACRKDKQAVTYAHDILITCFLKHQLTQYGSTIVTDNKKPYTYTLVLSYALIGVEATSGRSDLMAMQIWGQSLFLRRIPAALGVRW